MTRPITLALAALAAGLAFLHLTTALGARVAADIERASIERAMR